jgi:hypothetical protein
MDWHDHESRSLELLETKSWSSTLHALRSLWEVRRQNRELPARSDFAMTDLAPWLGGINLMSITDDGARIDVHGTRNSAGLGFEQTGLYVDQLPMPLRAVEETAVEAATAARAPVLQTVRFEFRELRRTYERLLLPLGNPWGRIEKLFVFIHNPRYERRLFVDRLSQRRDSFVAVG